MKKIGIAGVGGLGSNVAVNLIRCGITNLKIADFDRIEKSNLNRQFYFYDQIGKSKVETLEANLKRINPNVQIEKQAVHLDSHLLKQFFADCSIMVEGFDQPEYKKIFLETFGNSDKFIVMANGVAGYQVDSIQIRSISNGYIVGDFSTDVNQFPVFYPKLQIITAHMSHLILSHLDQYQQILTHYEKGWHP